jgi:hypothetical protein
MKTRYERMKSTPNPSIIRSVRTTSPAPYSSGSHTRSVKRWKLDGEGHVVETDPPDHLPRNEVVALRP